ncbi:DUF4394 domain-containing protein [Aquabacterium soli]|uniref:DUF4394 domain-containing protein n=1 Tax=Aquabacterium soli TaxID=2493092 RepID=A0A426VEU4_9BURK|nr:DUF4394 domain-containing protein [Aquabacterium soli]RRS05365.1 DUF4394 domain-containing protein [Aquabacterium soli]
MKLSHVALAAACLSSLLASQIARAEALVALTTDQKLLSFDSAAPSQGSLLTITGLGTDRLRAIDLRPSTGQVYALGINNNLYTLNTSTGAATLVVALSADPTDTSDTFTGLRGTAFGFDFNPVADLSGAPSLRVVSNASENLRIAVSGPNAGKVITDNTVRGGTLTIVASAYTNNDTNPATGTALYGIDAASDSLYQQGLPTSGVQTLIGSLGVNTSAVAGFDISAAGNAYAALTDGDTGETGLYSISLTPGGNLATYIGAFGVGGAPVSSIIGLTALAPVPEPATWAMVIGGLALVPLMRRRRQAAA